MAAGLGFKTFTTGEVLTAADTNGYLMQGILVFASAAARDAAITSPQEGQFAYLKDTNVTTYYTGSAWANVDTTGMTNPMTTTGDSIYSSSGSTPARLGIGSTGQVLTVASGVPSWATPSSGGGMTLINTPSGTTLTGSSVTISSIPATYNYLMLIIENFKPATDATGIVMRFNSDSNSRYKTTSDADTSDLSFNESFMYIAVNTDNSSAQGISISSIYGYANSTTWKYCTTESIGNNATNTSNVNFRRWRNVYNQISAVTSLTLIPDSGNFTSGTAYLYGVK